MRLPYLDFFFNLSTFPDHRGKRHFTYVFWDFPFFFSIVLRRWKLKILRSESRHYFDEEVGKYKNIIYRESSVSLKNDYEGHERV